MANVEKKKKRLQEKISFLEQEMLKALKQKKSTGVEISISDYMDRIATLKKELAQL
jgi:hypothetical protein